MNFIRIVFVIGACVAGSAGGHATEPSAAAPQRPWVTRTVEAPGVSFHTFESAAAKATVSYHLFTPAAYDREPQQRFPVVYWLHGSRGGLPGIPQVAARFAAAIAAGKTPPCLVVFVNGLPEGMYVDWKDGSAPLETMIVKELVPHVDASYRTRASREGRLLDGYSMGGYGAARLGFKYPELFRAVSIMGGGPLQADLLENAPRAGRSRAAEVLERVYGGDREYFRSVSPRALATEHAAAIKERSLVRMVCGEDDETFANNRDFHEHLARLGIPHGWTVLPGVDHDPLATLTALGDANWAFYRQAFADQPGRDAPPGKPDVEISFKVQDRDRRAVIVNAPTGDTERPVVIVLHGGMGSAAVMRANSGFDAVARSEGFMVVYAEGTEFGAGRHAWNTGFLLRRQVRDADDIAYFDALIDTLVRDHGADPERVFMTGGSNGGMMTFVYAVSRPERLAAIAPVVASMFTFETRPAVPLPILIINGAQDDEVPLAGGMSRNPLVRGAQDAPYKPLVEVVEFWVGVNRSQEAPTVETEGTVTTTVHAATPGGAATEFVVDSAGGHGWPGSTSRREGAAPIGSFSGAERVWQFFKDKQRQW
ncbi:MAG: alpha/beta fold hydrolase [Planctomycetia bacterium]|nr:alpha/beta fold hydrolase [Planctomycetia bacterium]